MAVVLHAMSDDPALTMSAPGCERFNGTLEAVEFVLLSIHDHQETVVVLVSAGFTMGHDSFLPDIGLMTLVTE
jgi:hypothetical protein